jgi:FkbM family methyltransferase
MTAGSSPARLSNRAHLTWFAHLFKSCVKQHHRELITPLRRFIPEDAVVLDVGGHAGQFAKLFARMAPKGHVYTFEPGSYALSILRPAIRFNNLRNITILPEGLSDSPGTATLHVPVKKSGSIGYGLGHIAGITKQRARRPTISDTISLTTIDRFASSENLTRLDFIKADIEGWEFRMIVGGEQTLSRFRPSLMVEVASETLARAGDTPDSLFSYFASINYDGYIWEPDSQRFHPVEVAQNNDVFFVPSERSSIMAGP